MTLNKTFLGYALAAMIASTAFCLIIFGERAKDPLEVLELVVPERLFARELGTTDRFSIALIARREIASLEVRLAMLKEGHLERSFASGSTSPLDELKAIQEVRTLVDLFDEAECWGDEIQTTMDFDGVKCDVVAIDFTPLYAQIADETDLRHTPTVLAAVFWPNQTLATYFRGYGTLFPAKEESLCDVRIAVGSETASFGPTEGPGKQEDVRPLSEAPELGLLRWSHVRKDDKVVVQYSVHGSAFKFLSAARAYFSKKNLLLIQVWVDGRPWRSFAKEVLSAVGD